VTVRVHDGLESSRSGNVQVRDHAGFGTDSRPKYFHRIEIKTRVGKLAQEQVKN
jgi:hypothetical protein